MSIYLGSRYETATVDYVPVTAGDNLAVFRGPSPLPMPRYYQNYLVVSGDRLDSIAFKVYGRSDYWWVIADANVAAALPDPLVAGTVLRIPDARDIY